MGKKALLTPKHPAERVYWKHGAYHYVDKNNQWHRLGEAWDRAAKEEWAKLSSSTPHEDSVAAMLEAHMAQLRLRVVAKDYSPETYAAHAAEVAQLNKFFGKMNKQEVRRRHVAMYLERRCAPDGTPSPIRANREVSLLSAAYSYEIKKQRLDDNPCIGVPRNKERPGERYVEHWERRQFAKRCCPAWLRAYLLLKYLTGLRMGDMLRLNHSAESHTGLTVKIGKSRRRKVLVFRWTWALRTTAGFIHRLAADPDGTDEEALGGGGTNVPVRREHSDVAFTGHFFRGREGHPITKAGFKSAWYRAMQKWEQLGNEHFTERDIRAKSGSDSRRIEDATARLGHDQAKTTARHYRRAAVKVNPLR